MPIFRDLPYLLPRIIRKCLPTALPGAVSRWLPGFRANAGTRSSARVLDLYDKHLSPKLGPDWPKGRRILEVGIGATNSSMYEAAARGATAAIAWVFRRTLAGRKLPNARNATGSMKTTSAAKCAA